MRALGCTRVIRDLSPPGRAPWSLVIDGLRVRLVIVGIAITFLYSLRSYCVWLAIQYILFAGKRSQVLLTLYGLKDIVRPPAVFNWQYVVVLSPVLTAHSLFKFQRLIS